MQEFVWFLGKLLIFSTAIAMASVIVWGDPTVPNTPPKIKRLALGGLLGLLVQFTLGFLMKHNGASLACPNFPLCQESFFPAPLTSWTALAFTHRWWGTLLLGHFFALAIASAKKAPLLAGATRRVFALSVAQVFLGIGAVMSSLAGDSRTIHSAVAYVLWGTLLYVVVRAGGARWLWTPFSSLSKFSKTPSSS